MNPTELAGLAARARSMREFLVALLLASGVLGLFFLIPDARPLPAERAAASTPDAFAEVPVEAKAAIVYDLARGATLYEKNAGAQLPLASLTKLLTVYAALSALPPRAAITISADAAREDAPRAFAAGETFALDDLARLTLTASLNDGAAAITEAIAAVQGRPAAAALAAAAAGLSLAQTYAVNGSGLDANAATSGGYGSARDIAVLAGALVRGAPEVAVATTERAAVAVSQSGRLVAIANTDPFVGTIPRLLLSKTGYTDLAGGNLALVFDAGIGHPIAVVVLGSSREARFTDGAALVAATLAYFSGIASLSP